MEGRRGRRRPRPRGVRLQGRLVGHRPRRRRGRSLRSRIGAPLRRRVVYTSGVWVYGSTGERRRRRDDASRAAPDEPFARRDREARPHGGGRQGDRHAPRLRVRLRRQHDRRCGSRGRGRQRSRSWATATTAGRPCTRTTAPTRTSARSRAGSRGEIFNVTDRSRAPRPPPRDRGRARRRLQGRNPVDPARGRAQERWATSRTPSRSTSTSSRGRRSPASAGSPRTAASRTRSRRTTPRGRPRRADRDRRARPESRAYGRRTIFSSEDRARIEAQGLTVEEVERQAALLRDPPPAAMLAASLHGRRRRRADRRRATTRRSSPSPTRPRARAGFRSSCPLPAPRAACSSSSSRESRASGGAPLPRERERPSRSTPATSRRSLALPKGLLPFHRYPDGARTAFEEHLDEAAATVRDAAGLCRVHVTVSPEHRTAFEDVLEEVAAAPRTGDGRAFRGPVLRAVALHRHRRDRRGGPSLPGFGGAPPLPAREGTARS